MRCFVALLFALAALPAAAQPVNQGAVYGLVDGREATPGGYYVNARPGEPVTRVQVWGRVLRPGVYDVGPGFDLESILSLAGISEDRQATDGNLNVVMKLYRSGESEAVYEATIQDFVREANPPAMEYGDVILVETEGVARVGVMGLVARPGSFEIGPGYDARDVVALAGGPAIRELRADETREVTVQIFRQGDAEGMPVYEQPLHVFLAGTGPAVVDGDVINIDSHVDLGWTSRDTFTVIGLVTSGVIAVVQIIRFL